MTLLLQDGAGALKKAKIKKNGPTMKMPLCVLHFDDKKRQYRIRLPDGRRSIAHLECTCWNPPTNHPLP